MSQQIGVMVGLVTIGIAGVCSAVALRALLVATLRCDAGGMLRAACVVTAAIAITFVAALVVGAVGYSPDG